MEIYTIGFTQTTAERFFGRLKAAGVRRLLDVRLKVHVRHLKLASPTDLPAPPQSLRARTAVP